MLQISSLQNGDLYISQIFIGTFLGAVIGTLEYKGQQNRHK